MNISQLISQIRSLINSAAGVEMAFGKPSKINDLHIIPVAKVAFGFGGGGGSSAAKNKKTDTKKQPDVEINPQNPEANDTSTTGNDADFGGGGGGGMQTYPVGIYTIKGDAVRFHPVISIKEIIALMTIISVVSIRMMKQNKKGK
ncbi:MAG: spore germination protein GerW family protein [Candidatus Cloacimonetes bacterium]|nr:spore germination protein GerW family protein [Candidatus Cloacimonadota bacterium]